jgi:hypothetical protein
MPILTHPTALIVGAISIIDNLYIARVFIERRGRDGEEGGFEKVEKC